jgi:hypothetical protein
MQENMMTTFANLLQPTVEEAFASSSRLPDVTVEPNCSAWDPDHYAEMQIRSLVRLVFCPGWPKPSRQVAFSAVDQQTDITGICEAISWELSSQVSGSVCLTEAKDGIFASADLADAHEFDAANFHTFRGSAKQLSSNLWKISEGIDHHIPRSVMSASLARTRVNDLRLQFDYTILHCASAVQNSEATLLGQFCDGVVLVLDADNTRRATARKAQQLFHASNAHVLGTVLVGRRFPIPESLYRRL